jgi:Zn-finger nucleic acid-binding protein
MIPQRNPNHFGATADEERYDRTVNCRNCGAAMELFERRKYYFCRYCGSFHFIESASAGGVETLAPSESPCAVCSAPLAKAILDKLHVIKYCERCRGVLLPRAVFSSVIEARRAFAVDPPTPPPPLDRRELQRQLACPDCRRRMEVHPYYGPGNIVIDSCSACNAIWLDHGEMQQIVDTPGKDRGHRFAPQESQPAASGLPPPAERDIAASELASLLDDLLF